jgi:hypothetical protein
MSPARRPPLGELLRTFDLDGLPERPFPTDGWSGAAFSTIEKAGQRFVLKRTSPDRDWIVRATRDSTIREAWIANRLDGTALMAPGPIRMPYLGAAIDRDETVLLMPDLSAELIAWDRPEHDPVIDADTLRRVLDGVARLHTLPWPVLIDRPWTIPEPTSEPQPWCPLPERLTLLTRRSAEGYFAEGNPVGARFLDGWDAFDRSAPAAARDLVDRLAADVTPLIDALGTLPALGLHGDLKLANVALLPDERISFIDWQLTLVAPVAVELGWLLVSNSGSLPLQPEPVVDSYLDALRWFAGRWGAADWPHDFAELVGDVEAQRDLTWIVGLLLRGWRKGLDTEAGTTLPSGMTAGEDLAWWSERAVAAADRRL